MLNMYLLSIIMIFCVLGIYFTIKEITHTILKNDIPSYVVLEVKDQENELENILRTVLSANPKSEIVVLDKSKNSETKNILNKFSNDINRIHIKTTSEK